MPIPRSLLRAAAIGGTGRRPWRTQVLSNTACGRSAIRNYDDYKEVDLHPQDPGGVLVQLYEGDSRASSARLALTVTPCPAN